GGLGISWRAMLSGRGEAEAREGLSRTSPSGSYLAARHAGDQRDAAAAASYYRAALRGDPDNNELLSRTFLAVLANGEVDEGSGSPSASCRSTRMIASRGSASACAGSSKSRI